MQQIFQTLQRFMQSSSCIFQFKPMDYPTQLQQHLITSYFQTALLLKTHSHNDMVRLLHTSERAVETFIAGVVYQMLLQPSNTLTFDTYMPSLRSESWGSLSKLVLQLLRDSFLWIKAHLRAGMVPLLAKLFYYRQMAVDHLILAVKTVNYADLSEQALNYNSLMLALFQQIMLQASEKQFSHILAKTMFYKIFKMLSLLVCVEEEGLREYKVRCVAVAERMFQLERERCLMIGNSGLNVFRQLEGEQLMQPLLAQLREALNSCDLAPQSPKSAALRLACVLPMKVQTTLLFIIREQISKIEIKLQLDWTFEVGNEHTLLVLMDILRYILALPVQELPMKECLCLLEWLFYRVCSNNVLFEVWKDELFFPCFAEPCPFPAAPERAIHFLAYLLDIDIDFGETILIYLLRNIHVPERAQILRNLLVRADQLQIINLSGLINHPRLRVRTKEELITALGRRPAYRGVERRDEAAVVYYDPLAVVVRKESEMSMDFSDSASSEEYLNSSQEIEQANDNQMEDLSKDSDKVGRIRLQKMFVQDMGEILSELLASPTLSIYKQFYKKFIGVTKQFRLSGQQSLIDIFLGQAAKISYVLFQNQFQNHQEVIPKQQNIIFYLLNIVAVQWRTNSLHGQITKKLIKKIAQFFATSQTTLWRNFLLFFKRTTLPVCREIKEWLFPKQKAQYAIPLLRELGPLTRQLIQNAQSLKLPLSL